MKKIYYVPCRETEAVIKNLSKNPLFSGIDYIPVEKGRVRSIRDSRAALIWGSGYDHHVSHFFSPKGRFYKVTYDAHNDTYKEKNAPIGYCNHTAFTAALKRCEGVTIVNKYQYDKKPCKNVFRYDKVFVLPGADVHVSVDMDCIANFPAHPIWQLDGRTGYSLDFVENDIRALAKNYHITRFDIGGLFLPEITDASEYSEFEVNPENPQVMNFAMDCYRSLLLASDITKDIA